ncbi:MAG: hypothetical protein EXR72_23545 [Myxococcales bacterium]|nr:hypothetical protein [Myxococcales bacterium]
MLGQCAYYDRRSLRPCFVAPPRIAESSPASSLLPWPRSRRPRYGALPQQAPSVKRRVYLTYPSALVREPVLCEMYDRLRVRFNVRTASVSEEIGLIGLELDGEPEPIEAALAFFRERGIRVEPIELDVMAG